MGDYSDFNMCDATGDAAAGVCHARGRNAELPPVWMVYFQVPDLAERGGQRAFRGPAGPGGNRVCGSRVPLRGLAPLLRTPWAGPAPGVHP